MRSKKLLASSALILASAAALAACGSNNSKSTTAKKQTLTWMNTAEMATLDASKATDQASAEQINNVEEGLYLLGKNAKVQNALATSTKNSADGKTWTFTLRKNAKWSNGDPVTAQDFVYSWRRTIDPKTASEYAYLFSGIKNADAIVAGKKKPATLGIKADGKYKLTVTLEKRIPYFKLLMAFPLFFPQNQKFIEKMGSKYATASKYMIYNGPYKQVGWTGSNLTWKLVKNDKYWGGQKDEGEVTIDRVDFKIIPEAGSRIAALQTGEATVIYPMPTDQVATVRSAGDINMVSMPSTTMRYVTLNTNVKELSDVRVRQAMNYAFNQDEYVKVMYAGAATPATSVLPALVPGYKEQEPFAYDLDKAKSLLKEAGYEDGFEVEIIGDNSTQETKGMTFVMQQLKKVGIEVKVVPNEAATNAEIAAEPEDTTKIQMWYVNWSQSDADGFMRSLLSTAMTPPTGYNTAFWKNEEFDNELQLGNEGKTEDEQNQHYAKCQDIVWPECPWLYLASDNTLMSYKAYLTGIKYVAQGIDVTHAKLNA